jgi:hypothetical protein
MPRSSKYRKTRRHLKSRRRQLTRRSRIQRGGDAPVTLQEWISNARDKFRNTPDTGFNVLGDYKDKGNLDDLKLSSIVEQGSDSMKLTYTQEGGGPPQDIRDVARSINAKLVEIVGQENLEVVTIENFKKALVGFPANPDRVGDDTVEITLAHLLACENSLRYMAQMDPLTPLESPIDALNSSTEPLFILALAINNGGDPSTATLFDPEDPRITSTA